VPPHLTHLASNLNRSILMFARERPLGPKDLDWLKIHVINLNGMKKRESIDEQKIRKRNIDLIVDNARNPLMEEM